MSNQASYIKDIISIVEGSATERIVSLQVSEKYLITPKNYDLVFPYSGEKFMHVWHTLAAEPKWRKKTKLALQLSLKKLSEMTEPEAIESMLQSIECNYQGIFPVNKKQTHVASKQNERVETIKRKLTDKTSSDY
jgi:hypothetical protein